MIVDEQFFKNLDKAVDATCRVEQETRHIPIVADISRDAKSLLIKVRAIMRELTRPEVK